MQSAVNLESDAAILRPECRQMAAKVRTVLNNRCLFSLKLIQYDETRRYNIWKIQVLQKYSLFPTYCTSSHIQATPKCFGHILLPSSGSTFTNICCTLQFVFFHLPKRLLYFNSTYDLSVKRNP